MAIKLYMKCIHSIQGAIWSVLGGGSTESFNESGTVLPLQQAVMSFGPLEITFAKRRDDYDGL